MIVIDREFGLRDMLRKYKIMIDDTCYGKIKNGEIETIELEPGHHRIYLKIDWITSNEVDFYISEGERIEFDCGNYANSDDESNQLSQGVTIKDSLVYGPAGVGARAFFKTLNTNKLWLKMRTESR